MAKLTLHVEKLEVESFETEDKGAAKGTVFGQETRTDQYATCAGHYTCDPTCDQTCGVPASCELINNYCGTYAEVGCPPSLWMCPAETTPPCV
ncbi:MAG: hypothetical protein ACJ8J0_24540 [Longimicrobiaceae bacterium]